MPQGRKQISNSRSNFTKLPTIPEEKCINNISHLPTGKRLTHPDLSYIHLHIGATKLNYITYLTLKDNGASHSFISQEAFRSIPYHETLPLTKGITQVRTASSLAPAKEQFYVTLWISFNTTYGRSNPIEHEFTIIDNLMEHIYFGNDILASSRKILETGTEMVFTSDINIKRTVTISPSHDLYTIPIYTTRRDEDNTKIIYQDNFTEFNIEEEVYLPPGGVIAIKQYLQHAHMYDPSMIFIDHYDQISITCEAIDHNHVTLSITNHNKNDPCHISSGDTFMQKHCSQNYCPVYASINNVSYLREILEEDQHLSPDERYEEIQEFLAKGHCQTSASHALEQHGRLQIFNPPPAKETVDFTPEQLIQELPIGHLDKEAQEQLRRIFTENINVLARNEFDVQHTDLIEATIEVGKTDKILDTKYIPVPAGMTEEADKLIQYYIDKGIISLADKASPFISNVIFVRKSTGKVRGILDARLINYNTKKLACSLTSHQEIMDLLSTKTHISTIDISNSYFSIKLSDDTAHYTTFFDHKRRRLQFKSCPQGWINSAYYLDQLLSILFAHIDDVLWVADDIIIATKGDLQHHFAKIEIVLKQLVSAKLRVKHTKLSICQEYTEFLGIMYSNSKMDIPEARIRAYMDFPIPTTPKQMKGFIASISYYRKFIPKYAELTLKLHKLSLLDNKQKFTLNEEERQDFHNVLKALKDSVSLNIPHPDRQYVCYSDASNYAISFVVEQEDNEQNRYPIAFLSKMLSKSEKNYSTFKKEAIALLYGLISMEFFLLNQPKIIVKTDAKSILFLRACKGSGTFLTRIALNLAAYPLEITHIPGNSMSQLINCRAIMLKTAHQQ